MKNEKKKLALTVINKVIYLTSLNPSPFFINKIAIQCLSQDISSSNSFEHNIFQMPYQYFRIFAQSQRQSYFGGTCKVRNEIETKRNATK